MNVTLDQARALDALARHGTFAAAAKALHKGHSAVLYSIDKLEEQTGLQLLDRGGYRSRLTTAGQQILEHCRRLLAAERDLVAVCNEIKTGWEPSLRVIFDGIFPAEPILRVVGALSAEGAPTRLQIATSFLGEVETRFVQEEADVMITVLPPQSPGLRVIKLPPLKARLVAHRSHPLARLEKLRREDLDAHVIVTVRGSDPRLQLSTGALERRSSVHLEDFAAKKAVILQGVGFGWLPEHMIQREIKRGELVVLPLDRGGTHAFEPRLCHRDERLGRAASRLVEALTAR
ncbi:MAG: LysR family transcriptional regulator [Polyangiales bacterium]